MFRPNCDSIIFDLDGTLWDASSTSAIAWEKVAKELGINISVDETSIKEISGLPFEDCVNAIFGSYVDTVPNLKSLLDDAERKEITEKGGRLYSDVKSVLLKLSHHYKLFLVSNCQEWYLNSFFDHSGLKNVFKDAICFGHTHRSKSENIKEIIKRNALKKSIYVGDTHWDQEAAYYAGAKFVFASYGFGEMKVSAPKVESLDELFYLMTAPELSTSIEVRHLDVSEFEIASSFYKSVGYVQTIQKQDEYFGAFYENEMIGLVRLAREDGCLILRGMQIKPSFHFFGIGTRLIQLLQTKLQNQECYCLPHGWLNRFYGQVGFVEIKNLEGVPKFLSDRLNQNRKKYPQLILMKREAI